MKKLIGTVAALLLVASAAFAEISISNWCTAIFAPVEYNGDDVMSALHAPWGGDGRAVGLSFSATSEDGKAGIASDLRWTTTNGLSSGDTYAMWVKPIDMLRITFGAWDYGTFRGDLCYGSWNYLRPNNAVAWGEGLTFAKLGAQGGVQLELKPIDGLTLMWNLPVNGTDTEAYKMFEQQEIAAMYEIDGIGKIKLGWDGNGGRNYETTVFKTAAGQKNVVDSDTSSGDEYKYLGDIWVGFDLTAVENLFVTVGGKIAIASSDYKKQVCDTDGNGNPTAFVNTQIGLGVSYKITDAFTVYADYAIAIMDNSKDGRDTKPYMSFGLGLDYGIFENLTLNVDFRGFLPGKEGSEKVYDPDFSFLVGATYTVCSNAIMAFGFQGYIAGEKSYNATQMNKEGKVVGTSVYPTQANKFAFAVPIKMQISF